MSMMVSPHRFATAAGSTFGALVNKSAGQAIGTSWAVLTWGAETYDTTGWHDNATDNSRLTIPSGVTLARVQGGVRTASPNSPHIKAMKNGSDFNGHYYTGVTAQSGWDTYINGYSPPMSVVAGDYFEGAYIVLVGSSTPSTEDPTWLAAEALSSSLKYAHVSKSANQAISAATFTNVTWDTETADADGWHDNVTNNTRLTVPSGVSLVRVSANVVDSNVSGRMFSRIKKNGSAVAGSPCKTSQVTVNESHNIVSPPMVVTPGDYFEVEVWDASAANILTGTYTWACIEEVPSTWKRALVSKSGNQALSAAPASTAITFDQETYDTDSIHDNATNNTRLTVPSGVTKARLSYGLSFSSTGSMVSWVTKNGAAYPSAFRGTCGYSSNLTAGSTYHSGISAWVDVTPGDYFELFATVNSAQNVLSASETWFAMECQ
jgi:hypothetical protein